MIQRLAIHRAHVRHLSVVQLILDVVMQAAVGMLAMFVLLLASFQNFDALFFESGLRYDNRAVIDAPTDDGLVLTVTEGVRVMSARRYDDPTRWSADLNDSVSPLVWSADEPSGESLENLLGASVVDTTPGQPRVFLDRASAGALGVDSGDDLVLATSEGDVCRVRLTGVTRSYKEVGGSFTTGLIALPAEACADGVTTWTEGDTTYLQFDAHRPVAAAQSWGERMLAVALAATDFQVSGLLPVVLLVGLGLWTLATLRGAARVRRRLEPAADLLVDLGCRPARVRTTPLLVTSAATVVAAGGAAWGAHEALRRMASFYTQPEHWISVALLFSATTIAILLTQHLRLRRRSSRRPARITTPTTSTTFTTPGQGER